MDDVFGVLVAYEVFALISRRFPTYTTLCRRNRRLIPICMIVMVAHLAQRATDG